MMPPCPPPFPYSTLFRSPFGTALAILLGLVEDLLSLGSGVHAMRFRSLGMNSRAERKEILHQARSEEHTSELQSQSNLVCRLPPEKKNRVSATHAERSVL